MQKSYTAPPTGAEITPTRRWLGRLIHGIGPRVLPALVKSIQHGVPLFLRARDRIGNGTYRLLRGPDDVELAIAAGPADEHRPPGVIGLGVDGYHSLRRIQTLPLDGVADGFDIGDSRLGHRMRPEPNAVVRSADDIVGDAILAITTLKRIDERSVLRTVDALKVIPRRVMAHRVARGQLAQFIFGNAEGNNGRSFRADAGFVEFAIESNIRISHHGAQNDVRLGLLDPLHHAGHLRTAEEDIFFPYLLRLERGELIFDNLVDGMGPNVIGADQEELARVEFVVAPLDDGNDLLVGSSAGVNDVLGLFEAFVSHGINQQVIVFFENRLHGLSAGGGPTTEHHADLIFFDELAGFAGVSRPIGVAVANHGLDGPPEQATRRR